MTKVMISVCSIRAPDQMHTRSMFNVLNAKFPDIEIIVNQHDHNDVLIDRARSLVVEEFLSSDSDILLFIDDDVVFAPEGVEQIVRDCEELKTVVCGLYAIKNISGRIAVHPLNDRPIFWCDLAIGPKGRLFEVKYGVTGFMAIPRKVLRDIADTLPMVNSNNFKGKDIRLELFRPMFQPFYPDGYYYLSEDYAFCYRAKALGYKIMADSRIVLGHIGRALFQKA